jgi:hypothetical protein
VLTGAWPTTFRLALLDKDVRIALELIGDLGLDAPVLARVADAVRAARSALGEGADYLEAGRNESGRRGERMTTWLDTRRERVEITVTGNRTLVGDIHLLLAAETHAGPESAVDLLNRHEPFFAVTFPEEQTVFLAKSQVLVVTLPPPPRPAIDDPQRESAARHLQLEVEMADGSVFEGDVALELPPDRARLLDFLNLAPPFFALSNPEGIRLIHRAHVRTVSPVAQVPRGAA